MLISDQDNNNGVMVAHKLHFLLLVFNFFAFIDAAHAFLSCDDQNVHTIDRPTFPDVSTSPKFSYKFRFNPPSDANQPVVIFFDGGPGEGSITRDPSNLPVPSDKNKGLVTMDPRGTGCNSIDGIEKPASFYTSRSLVLDAKAIVEWLHSQNFDNYILVGQSYGTILATETAFLLETSTYLHAPKAVVLVGVLGRAYINQSELLDGFTSVWKIKRNNLSQPAQEALAEPQPLGFGAEAWGAFLQYMLQQGQYPNSGNYVDPLISALNQSLAPKPYYDVKAWTVSLLSAEESDFKKTNSTILNPAKDYIVCREISQYRANYYFSLVKGELKSSSIQKCRGSPLSQPYDSANFLMKKTPIYYFSGGQDPVTPPWQAEYHMQNQIKTERYFIRVPQGGHGTLSINLSDCKNEVFSAIFNNGIGLGSALKTCSVPSALESILPQ